MLVFGVHPCGLLFIGCTWFQFEARWRNSESVNYWWLLSVYGICNLWGKAAIYLLICSLACLNHCRSMLPALVHKLGYLIEWILTGLFTFPLRAHQTRSFFAPGCDMRAQFATRFFQLFRPSVQVCVGPQIFVITWVTALRAGTDKPFPSLCHLWHLLMPWSCKVRCHTVILLCLFSGDLAAPHFGHRLR